MKKHLLILLFSCLFTASISAQIFNKPCYNFDFEYLTQLGEPKFWNLVPFNKNGGSTQLDSNAAFSGTKSVLLTSPTEKSTASVGQYFPYELFKGKKHIKVTVYVKGDTTSLRKVSLHIKPLGSFVQYHSQLTEPKANEWNKLEAEGSLDSLKSDKKILLFGYLEGIGQVWFDKFSIQLDGVELIDNQPLTPAEWLNKSALPIAIKGEDWSDLRPLSKYLADKRIVALGEGTHGTKEFNEVRTRLTHYLVEQENFDYVVMEDEVFETDSLNEYIVNGRGDAKTLIDYNIKAVWRCPEFLELIEILKKHNATHPKKVKFIGVDMQHTEGGIQQIKVIAERNRQDSLSYWLDQFEKEAKLRNDSTKRLIVNDLKRFIDQNLERFVVADTSLLLFCTRVLEQNATLNAQKRDAFMAENLTWYAQKNPNSKFIVWAHNGHIQRGNSRMGQFLSRKFGKNYYAVGTFTAEGTVNAIQEIKGNKYSFSTHPFVLETPQKQHLEYYLAQATPPQYFFPIEPFDKILYELQQITVARGIGAVMGEGIPQFYQQYPFSYFNAFIFIKKTTASPYWWQKK